MKIAISAESTIDLTKELLNKYDIKTVPFTILLGDKSELDGEITSLEIINFVKEKKVLPKTSAVNRAQFEEFFGELLKEYDAVVHFSLSDKLSSTYANALSVAEGLKNVYVIDTASLSTGIALLAIYARKLADKGYSAEEVYNKSLKRVSAVQASFVLSRLDYLYKGGRCSALAYFGANLFKIKPQIIVTEGKMISGKKFKGSYPHVVNNYCKDVLEKFNTPDLSQAFITYTTADKETLDIAEKYLKEAGFKNINYTNAGGTITSHCGEDCLGILFINDGEQEV